MLLAKLKAKGTAYFKSSKNKRPVELISGYWTKNGVVVPKMESVMVDVQLTSGFNSAIKAVVSQCFKTRAHADIYIVSLGLKPKNFKVVNHAITITMSDAEFFRAFEHEKELALIKGKQ